MKKRKKASQPGNGKAGKRRPLRARRPGRKQSQRDTSTQARLALLQNEAVTLKAAGLSYRQIADRQSVSVRTAYERVQAGFGELDEATRVTAERWRERELETLDMLQRHLVPMLQLGLRNPSASTRAALALVKVLERRARFMGWDQPIKVAPTNPEGTREFAHLTKDQIIKELLTMMPDLTPELLEQMSETSVNGGEADE